MAGKGDVMFSLPPEEEMYFSHCHQRKRCDVLTGGREGCVMYSWLLEEGLSCPHRCQRRCNVLMAATGEQAIFSQLAEERRCRPS